MSTLRIIEFAYSDSILAPKALQIWSHIRRKTRKFWRPTRMKMTKSSPLTASDSSETKLLLKRKHLESPTRFYLLPCMWKNLTHLMLNWIYLSLIGTILELESSRLTWILPITISWKTIAKKDCTTANSWFYLQNQNLLRISWFKQSTINSSCQVLWLEVHTYELKPNPTCLSISHLSWTGWIQ